MTSYIRCTECGGHATGGLLRDGGRYRLSPCGHTAAVEIVEDKG